MGSLSPSQWPTCIVAEGRDRATGRWIGRSSRWCLPWILGVFGIGSWIGRWGRRCGFHGRFMADSDLVLAVLDLEWERIVRCRQHRREFESWRSQAPHLAEIECLAELVERIDSAPVEESTEMVWALLELVAESELATRAMLQVIVLGLGGELAWLNRWSHRTDPSLLGGGDIDQMLVVSGLEAIAHAAGHRRAWPICSILRRTHRVLMREVRAPEEWHDRVDLEGADDDAIAGSAQVEVRPETMLLELFRQASDVGVLAPRGARLLWLMGVDGYTSSELAEPLGTTPRAVATRRLRAEQRLTRMVSAA